MHLFPFLYIYFIQHFVQRVTADSSELLQIRDNTQEPCGRLSFMREPRNFRSLTQNAICNLNITLPSYCKVRTLLDSTSTVSLRLGGYRHMTYRHAKHFPSVESHWTSLWRWRSYIPSILSLVMLLLFMSVHLSTLCCLLLPKGVRIRPRGRGKHSQRFPLHLLRTSPLIHLLHCLTIRIQFVFKYF